MTETLALPELAARIGKISPRDPQYATQVVDSLLEGGRLSGASDLHLQPGAEGLEILLRIDGVLQQVGILPGAVAPNLVARLKVLAQLLTYRTDLPQEGRVAGRSQEDDGEVRVSTFPTLYGERAVVRFFAGQKRLHRLDDLGLPDEVSSHLRRLLVETSGAILVTGPAGSGKTTTVYACLRELAAATDARRSLVSLEDPIEVAVPGVAQSEVKPAAGFDLATGLRFLMRQDPEVIMVGEIRDRSTAEAAVQASLTGHLLVSTFHAGSATEAVGRLTDMGIEPYQLRSGLLAIVNQRLARRLCGCAVEGRKEEERLGLPIRNWRVPNGCLVCHGTGYRGRTVLVELLTLDDGSLSRAVLSRTDTAALERLAVQSGMVSRWQRACQAVEAGRTSPAEVRRVLGFGTHTG